MFSFLFEHFSRERIHRSLTVSVAAVISVYFLFVFVAEPLRAFGATTATYASDT